MRSPVNALRPFLVGETRRSLEQQAAEVFDLDQVKQTLTEYAALGMNSTRLSWDGLVDLQDTAAARALVEKAVRTSVLACSSTTDSRRFHITCRKTVDGLLMGVRPRSLGQLGGLPPRRGA